MKIVKNEDQRVAVLVDVQNMYYSARSLYEAKVNFGNLMEAAVAGRKLVRAVAYVITTGEEDEKEKAFFEALYKAGFDIKQKELQIFKGGAKKGDWDVGIAIDAISMAEKMDSIILFSGDGDYVPMAEYLKLAKGCAVEVVAFGQTCSHRLREVADFYIDIEENKAKFLIKGRGKKSVGRSKPVSISKGRGYGAIQMEVKNKPVVEERPSIVKKSPLVKRPSVVKAKPPVQCKPKVGPPQRRTAAPARQKPVQKNPPTKKPSVLSSLIARGR